MPACRGLAGVCLQPPTMHPVVTVDEILTFAREELQGKDDEESHAYVGVRHRVRMTLRNCLQYLITW